MAAGIAVTIAFERVAGRKKAKNDGEWNRFRFQLRLVKLVE